MDEGWRDVALGFIQQAHSQARAVTLTATEKTYSPAEVGRMTGTSKSGVHRRIEDGTIKALRVGTRWLITESEVARYRAYMMDGIAAMVVDEPFDE